MTRLHIIGQVTEETHPIECGICGARFAKHQLRKYDDHMAGCGNSETAEVMASYSPRRRMPFFDESFGDAEYGAWVKANAKAIIEGRKKM